MTTTNRDIARLRSIARRGVNRVGAGKEMGWDECRVRYWTKREGIRWEPLPAPGYGSAMGRLLDTMAQLRG